MSKTITVTLEDLSKALVLPLAAFIEQVIGIPATPQNIKQYQERTVECLEQGLFEGLVEDFDKIQEGPKDEAVDLGISLGLYGDGDDEEEPGDDTSILDYLELKGKKEEGE